MDERKEDEGDMKLEIDAETVKKMYYLCDICIKSTTDVLDVVHDYTSDFYEAFFGDNVVKSDDKMKNSEDYHWRGLSLDVLLNDAKKLKFNKNLMINQMLKDIQYIKENLR